MDLRRDERLALSGGNGLLRGSAAGPWAALRPG
jgi:hypothetical protein